MIQWDIDRIRQDFPILSQTVHNYPLAYLDNAATTQKPKVVIEAISHFYTERNANVHRGLHYLSEQATLAYENARKTVQQFIHASSDSEIVFVRGTTEAINLIAQTYGRSQLVAGDEVIISTMEHHANIVPWQMLCQQMGIVLKVVPVNDAGELDMAAYADLFNDRTRLVSIVHVSNVLGTVNPIETIIKIAHDHKVPVVVDGAQAILHQPIDVQKLDCDFYTFSSHKMYGTMGIGVLYGKRQHLETMPPYQGGGDMIARVSFERTTYQNPPYKFEAGTPAVADAIGLEAAIKYILSLGFDAIRSHESDLKDYAMSQLTALPKVRLMGTASERAAIFSFEYGDVHAHDVSTVLDQFGVAVRAGHHCAMPLAAHYGISATVRASCAVYNTRRDIDQLIEGLSQVDEVFS